MLYLDTTGQEWQKSKVDGIYSKELIHHPEGGGKLILLKPGAHYPEHRHPNRTEYVYVVEGSPYMTVGNERFAAKTGAFVTMPADTLHSLGNESDRDAVLFIGAIQHQPVQG